MGLVKRGDKVFPQGQLHATDLLELRARPISERQQRSAPIPSFPFICQQMLGDLAVLGHAQPIYPHLASARNGVTTGFAGAYFTLTNFGVMPFLPSHSSPLAWYEAVVLSISSFHGRGLFPTGLSLGDPVAILAAVEAIIGLLIEITFIATFTQRFFAR